MKTAVVAVVISLISLIATIVLGTKNYRKSKRDAFVQRQDHLRLLIAELNTTSFKAQLILARYVMVVQNLSSLRLEGEQAERINKQLASIKRGQENLETRTKRWDEYIEVLHSTCSKLTFKTDVERIEKIISIVQVETDNLKRDNEGFFGSLHILENTEPLLKADVEKMQEYARQLVELDHLYKALTEIIEQAPG